MSTITFADLAAIAIDTDSLPPMMRDTLQGVKRIDHKRGDGARRETLARKQARVLTGKAA